LSPRLVDTARRLVPLAWPVFIGQVAVLAFSTVDTLMIARYAALDLAALAVGAAAYITIFIGLMGVVLAVAPIAGQLYGAQRFREAGEELQQAVWLALGASAFGCTLLLWPEPFLQLAHASPQVAAKARGHLTALAFALPPALVFTAYRGFNVAVSRPKAVMALQLGALLLKVPLNALFIHGFTLPGGFVFEAMGTPGCGTATAVVMWCQALAAWWVIRRDPFYARFELQGRPFSPPRRAGLVALLRLGAPMGMALLIEVTGFTSMAFFISRIGATPVAGHQIAANLVSLLFMMPLALANATGTVVAQRIGAGDPLDAQRVGVHGLQIGLLLAAVVGGCIYLTREAVVRLYTHDAVIIAAALPLLSWVVLFHIGDAAQTLASFILRAYRIAAVPVLIYAVSLWGIGLGGGYVIAFNVTGSTPPGLLGARGFWFASTVSLAIAGLALGSFLAWVWRQKRSER